jgi:hypothetical protein
MNVSRSLYWKRIELARVAQSALFCGSNVI